MRAELPLSVHLVETPEETELLETHTGPLVDFLKELGVWDANGFREIPLRVIADRELGANQRTKCRNPRADACRTPADRNGAIELQVANVAAIVVLNMVHNRPIGEVTIEGKVARDTFGNDPINQLFGQDSMVLKRMLVSVRRELAAAARRASSE